MLMQHCNFVFLIGWHLMNQFMVFLPSAGVKLDILNWRMETICQEWHLLLYFGFFRGVLGKFDSPWNLIGRTSPHPEQ
jgi:hypothetical protein